MSSLKSMRLAPNRVVILWSLFGGLAGWAAHTSKDLHGFGAVMWWNENQLRSNAKAEEGLKKSRCQNGISEMFWTSNSPPAFWKGDPVSSLPHVYPPLCQEIEAIYQSLSPWSDKWKCGMSETPEEAPLNNWGILIQTTVGSSRRLNSQK